MWKKRKAEGPAWCFTSSSSTWQNTQCLYCTPVVWTGFHLWDVSDAWVPLVTHRLKTWSCVFRLNTWSGSYWNGNYATKLRVCMCGVCKYVLNMIPFTLFWLGVKHLPIRQTVIHTFLELCNLIWKKLHKYKKQGEHLPHLDLQKNIDCSRHIFFSLINKFLEIKGSIWYL